MKKLILTILISTISINTYSHNKNMMVGYGVINETRSYEKCVIENSKQLNILTLRKLTPLIEKMCNKAYPVINNQSGYFKIGGVVYNVN